MEMSCKYTVVLQGKLGTKQRSRSTQNGHHYTPHQTVLAENWIRLCYLDQVGESAGPTSRPVRLLLEIDVPIPPSWSKAKQLEALMGETWPTKKPDWDNAGKLVSDALNGIAWLDDAQVVDGRVVKRYGIEPLAVLTIEHL